MPLPNKDITSDEASQVFYEGLREFDQRLSAAQPRPVAMPVVSMPITETSVTHAIPARLTSEGGVGTPPLVNGNRMSVYGMFNGGFAPISIVAEFE